MSLSTDMQHEGIDIRHAVCLLPTTTITFYPTDIV